MPTVSASEIIRKLSTSISEMASTTSSGFHRSPYGFPNAIEI